MRLVLALALTLACGPVSAETVRIAVASNFRIAMQALQQQFEATSKHRLSPSYASTGKHYAQIVNGAPFAMLLAADSERPRRLEEQGVALADSRFSYALGRLVLWNPARVSPPEQGGSLSGGNFRFVAIANPQLAPYGEAAMQVLQRVLPDTDLSRQLLRGENVAQAYQFVASGNADLGLVAESLVSFPGAAPAGSFWRVPASWHTPIAQQAVLLKATPGALAFRDFLQGAIARDIIGRHGYELP